MKRLHADQPSQEFIECDFEEFESFDPSTSNTHKHTRNHNQLRNLAIMCDRYQISDRAGAAIANAVLQGVTKVLSPSIAGSIYKK